VNLLSKFQQPIRKRRARKPAKILLVSTELLGLSPLTESAASTAGLSQHFAGCGEDVTLLWVPGEQQFEEQKFLRIKKNFFDHYLVNVEIMTESEKLLPLLWPSVKQSLALYHYLKQHTFDAVYITLEGGLAYYSLLAR
jgi:hypothetical protein